MEIILQNIQITMVWSFTKNFFFIHSSVVFHFSSPRETASLIKLKATLQEHIFCSPKELLKLSVPSVVYAIQNNMAFIALSNLDVAVYQVLCESGFDVWLLWRQSTSSFTRVLLHAFNYISSN